MIRKIIILALFAFIGTPIWAQLENIPLITVYGESVIQVKPDYVLIGLKVKKKINVNNNAEARTIFEIFKKEDTKVSLFDFDEKNIYEGYIQYDSSNYIKEIFIKILDLNKLDKYLLEIYQLGFKDIIYVDYRITNLNEYKNKARIDAINSAKKKATLLANELGQMIGKAHNIEEIFMEEYNWYNIHNSKNKENLTFKLGADNYLIEPGYITITSKIKVSFDLQK
jgi:uncharacterized protein